MPTVYLIQNSFNNPYMPINNLVIQFTEQPELGCLANCVCYINLKGPVSLFGALTFVFQKPFHASL